MVIATRDDDTYNGWLRDLEKPITPRTKARLAKLYTK